MRKSDPTITNNVIPFPKRPKNRSSGAMASSPQSIGPNCWISSVQVTVVVPAAVETNRGVGKAESGSPTAGTSGDVFQRQPNT
jgi:hypothetical protein